MSHHLEIAQVIFSQIGGNHAMAMIGGKNVFAVDEKDGALSFMFKAENVKKINYCKVVLDFDDTYTVEFGRKWGSTYKVIDTKSNVYCDELMNMFEEVTNVLLSLFPRA